MNRSLFISVLVLVLCGCGGSVTEVAELERMKEKAPVVGQLPLELTSELRAAGATEIAAYSGPWLFRRDKVGRLHEGDLLQVDVVGVPGLERSYLEYINEEVMWVPEGVRPVKCRRRTQEDIAREFPSRASIPQTPGLRIRVLGPYSTDCFVVGGEVRRRGFYLWQEGMTLRQAFTTAGGVRREMPAGKIQVVRGDRAVTFSLHDVLDKATQPFPVKPLDAISVMEAVDMKFDARKLGVLPPEPKEK
ncbi:MAG: SLBB domain-containing protein [Verrucomicrobia bacterium]|nr:SLBB domain-containing protein [Verrucomicrobiota bacterium]